MPCGTVLLQASMIARLHDRRAFREPQCAIGDADHNFGPEVRANQDAPLSTSLACPRTPIAICSVSTWETDISHDAAKCGA
jgi:hypothetical protein